MSEESGYNEGLNGELTNGNAIYPDKNDGRPSKLLMSVVQHSHHNYYGDSNSNKRKGLLESINDTNSLKGLGILGLATIAIGAKLLSDNSKNIRIDIKPTQLHTIDSSNNKDHVVITSVINGLNTARINLIGEINGEERIIEKVDEIDVNDETIFPRSKNRKAVIINVSKVEHLAMLNRLFTVNKKKLKEVEFLVVKIYPTAKDKRKQLIILSKKCILYDKHGESHVKFDKNDNYERLNIYKLALESGFDPKTDDIAYVEEKPTLLEKGGVTSYFEREPNKFDSDDLFYNAIYTLYVNNKEQLVFQFEVLESLHKVCEDEVHFFSPN